MPSTLETFAMTGHLDQTAREALRPAARRCRLEGLGLSPAGLVALRRYRDEAAGGSVPAVGRGLSRVDRLVVHSVAVLGMSPSAVSTALGAPAHWGLVAVRIAASALAGRYRAEGVALDVAA
jgi:hypothetical protein